MFERPTTVRHEDYRPPAWAVLGIDLQFCLDDQATRVVATTRFQARTATLEPLLLDGEDFVEEDLRLDGVPVAADACHRTKDRLVLQPTAREVTLQATTRLCPAANAALSGLYVSGGRLCTQCEAEGFRRITWSLDRPDVLTRYTVRLEADRARYPTLLCNGDEVARGELPGGRHFATFHDPHPKPTYLFAIAAGHYESIRGSFTTASGRPVTLWIHVDPGSGSRAWFALQSLQAAMRWDEVTYQREYDLSVYHVVAVRDFNFGAMENKGLNIFNSAYVLADPAVATDADYEGIEAVIGHEYFHNWTGNRITCRDWFQLSLKEGLTVFREQQFAAAMRSPAVQRIKDVRRLRSRQFPEDQGPLAHPVRPASYQAIDNFYTATIYEKGAEVIRMVRTTIGEVAFARGMDLYFARRDGTASTVEDLLGCLADGADTDLGRFLAWYDQAGTPELTVTTRHDPRRGTCTLQLTQRTPPTPGQPDKRPLPLPLRIGFLAPDGSPLALRADHEAAPRPEHLVVFDAATATLVFHGAATPPIPAVLRGFSAPVRLIDDLTPAQRRVQMAHDPDPFTRWEAGQALARALLLATAADGAVPPEAADALAQAYAQELARAATDPAFTALALRLPEVLELLAAVDRPDPDRLQFAHVAVRARLATALRPALLAIVDAPAPAAGDLGAAAGGQRALRAVAYDLLGARGAEHAERLAAAFAAATTMTETIAALEALGSTGTHHFAAALATFHGRYRHEPLVLDKWFAVQATVPRPDAVAAVERLRQHPDFDLGNPNRVRSLARAFAAGNPAAFHAADGGGYRFVAAVVAAVDPRNPALAAKLLQAFESWRRFDATRQAAVRAALTPLLQSPSLSKNSREMLERTLA